MHFFSPLCLIVSATHLASYPVEYGGSLRRALEVKWRQRDADNYPPSSAEVNMWSFTFAPLFGLYSGVHGHKHKYTVCLLCVAEFPVIALDGRMFYFASAVPIT
jgi:hypothetical protein